MMSLAFAESKSPEPPFAARQMSVDGVSVARLSDLKRGIDVSILPSMNNMAYEMTVHGKNILYFPEIKLPDFQKRPAQVGIPFLAPWANRIDGTGFYANGKKYEFDFALGNLMRDQRGLSLHGVLSNTAPWRVTDIGADGKSAHVTSKLDFWKIPGYMAQWPFAHEYEMTYILADGALEVRTTVSNKSVDTMPLAIGFHPYYRIPDVPRDEWLLRLPSCKAVIADERRVPTGEFKALDLPNPLPLQGRTLDDGFTDFERDANGRAVFSIESGEKKIELVFGPQYPVAVIWEPASPPGRPMNFLCVEPMTAITNGVNLHHQGKYPGLQMVAPDGKWTGSFWIRPVGF